MTAAVRPRQRIRAIPSILFDICYSLFVISPAFAGELRGKVTDPDGRAVAKAEVIVHGATATPQRVTSSDDGSYVIANIPAGSYSVFAVAPGFVSNAISVDVTDAQPAIADLKLRISAINETLVVSAAQIDQPLSRTPDSVTVIGGAEIDAKQQYTLGSALRSVPGLTLQQSGGPGSLTSLFTRGGESDYTLVLVDGVRVNAFGGGLDFSQVPLQDVERIEVLRGPQSALYGADAIGGVIQVMTRSGGDPSAQAQFGAGSRNMRRAAASTSGEAGGLRWQLGGNYVEDEGFTGTAANGQAVT